MTAERAPVRLIILCDGTFQIRRQVTPSQGVTPTAAMGHWFSNVALLARCITQSSKVPGVDGRPIPQILYYQSGIGTGGVHDTVGQLLEGATGLSLGDKVDAAYGFLVDNYLPGDEILLFGFSRGAYTARALAAFINYAGIMSKLEMARSFAKIWKSYRQRVPIKASSIHKAEETFYKELGRWPSGNAMRSARGNVKGANELIGKDEIEKGATEGEGEGANESVAGDDGGKDTFDLSNRYPRVNPPQIKVVGVWDTVGALGVPGNFLAPDLSRYYSFFDPILAPNVTYGFHALALDEDRKDFLPTLWYLPKAGTEIESDVQRRQGQVLEQMWFQGSHTDVGGGHPWHGLSDITLAWMISRLTDSEGGPLLSIDLDVAKKLQDRRRPWARQGEHPSRIWIEFQSTRNVGWWNIPEPILANAVWKDLIEVTNTNEKIHYSVHIGNRYNPETSPQFKKVRVNNLEALCKMWTDNNSQDSLWPSEKALLWKEGEPESMPDSAYMGKDRAELSIGAYRAGQDVEKNDNGPTDPQLGVARPGGVPASVWKVLKVAANLPVIALATIVNLSPTPNRNLKPGIFVSALASIQSKMRREHHSQTALQKREN